MQTTTADYKLEINKPSRSFECKITIGNNIYTNEDLVNLTLEYTQPQEGFAIGNTISQSLDLTLLNRGDIIYSTSQIKVEIGLKMGSTIEYILMGIFNIDDIDKTDYTTKFTCYDNVIKFETPYFSSLGDKPTLKQVVNELSNLTGVEFTGSLPDYNVSKLEGFTCREVLSYVASICGGNAFITRDGKFTIKSLSEVEKSIDGNNYFDYTREEVKYKVGQISCQVDENNILSKGSTGTDSMELGFENPWVTETILTEIYNKLNGLSYLGYSMKWQGDISLDPYDIITVTDVKNVIRKMPILSQKITYTGGLTSEIGAKGETKNKNSFSSSGSTTNKVNRAVIEQAIIKEALIEKANIKDVEAANAKIQNLVAEDAKINNALINKAEIKDLNATNANIQKLIAEDAKINNALINKADINQLNAVQGNITSLNSDVANIKTLVNGNLSSENIQAGGITSDKLTIANGFIKNAMIDNLDVSKVNAGDISTNKFRIVSDSGKMLISDNTIQIRDNNRARVQIGKDASSDYNMYIWDKSGKLMFDATGLKADGIKNKIIRDDMISDNANIAGSKINVGSLVTEINKDTNTSLIKASKVAIDLTGQSLEVSFNSLKSNVDNIKIGGRNLLLNGRFDTLKHWYSTDNINIQLYSENNVPKGFKCSNVSNGQHVRSDNNNNLKPNSEYTLSYFQKNITSSRVWIGIYYTNKNGTPSYISLVEYDENIYEDFTKRVVTFKTPEDAYNFQLRIYMYSLVETIFKDFKIENGNKATDWTPAPEDINNAIEDVKQITESNSTTINVMQGQISTAINNTQIVKDGKTVLLKDDYNRTVAKVDSINSTMGSHTTKIDQLTGNITNVDTKVNSVQRDLEGTKSTVSNHTTQINGLNSTVSTQGSSISQLKDKIALKVEASDITNAINNIQIGGRNLLFNSTCINNFEGWSIKSNYFKEYRENNINKGFYVEGGNGVCISSKEIVDMKQLEEYTLTYFQKNTVASKVWIGVYYNNNSYITLVNYDTKVYLDFTKITVTFRTPSGANNFYIRFYEYSTTLTYIKDIQIEKGNKVSDWTPAPEDIDHAISSVDSKVTTTSNKVATIETNLSGITQRVSSTESTISTHTTQLGTVDNRINTAKNAAISTAASDATTKANNAQSKALADAKSYTNGQITTVTETINSRVAEIKATTDGITQKVSANETKVNTITTSFNNLQIGGRNYIVATKVGCYSSYNTINTSTSGYIKSTWNANWTGNTFTINVAGFAPKKAVYTMSGIIKVNGAIPTAKYFTGYASTYGSNLIRNDYDATTGKFVITQSYPGNSSWLFHATTTRASKSTDVVELFNLKFEEGNKATDWTPAPEDVTNAINNVDSKVESTKNQVASIETNLSGITQRVSNTESITTTLKNTMSNVTSAHGLAYTKDLVIYGESNKYYPVYFKNGNQDILRTIKIWRAYYEQGPNDWHSATHKGGLMLTWQGNFGGWGGATYKDKIVDYSCTYATLLADCYITMHSMGYVFFLRGGGSGGALYHFASDQSFTPEVYYNGSKDLVYDNANDAYKVYAANPLTTVNTARLNGLIVAKESSVTTVKNQVASIETNLNGITSRVSSTESKVTTINGNITSLQSRMNTAEQKITDSAIIATVQSTINTAKNEAIKSSNRVFTSTPTTPYKVGDLWLLGGEKLIVNDDLLCSDELKVDSSAGDLYKCIKSKETGEFSLEDWELATKYTDDTKANEIKEGLNSLSKDYEVRINSVEQKITPTAITTTISEVITGGIGSISTTQFVMDKSGLTIKNGALTIKNKLGATVLSSDTNGNIILNGTVKTQHGDMYVAMHAGGIDFKDHHLQEQMMRIGLSYFEGNRDQNGVSFALAQYGDYIRFSHIAKTDLTNGWSNTDTQYVFMDMWSADVTIGSAKYKKGINVFSPMYLNNGLRLNYKNAVNYQNYITSTAWNSVEGLLGIYGDNGTCIGYQDGSNLMSRIVVTEAAMPGTGDNIKSWGNWNCSGYTVHNATFSGRWVNSYANFTARTLTETTCIEAENKQVRVNFEDIQLQDGKAILNIPKRYMHINTGYTIASIVKKGKGDVWVAEELENRFILAGTEDIKVNIEVIINIEESALYTLKSMEDQLCIDMSTGQPVGA